MPWDPDRYNLFKNEGEAPFGDLLALVDKKPGLQAVDLGRVPEEQQRPDPPLSRARLDHGRLGGAIDGQAALDALKASIPDILLLDLSLPQVDGWTVTRRLREDAQYENLWIIAVTAHAMAGDRERPRAAR